MKSEVSSCEGNIEQKLITALEDIIDNIKISVLWQEDVHRNSSSRHANIYGNDSCLAITRTENLHQSAMEHSRGIKAYRMKESKKIYSTISQSSKRSSSIDSFKNIEKRSSEKQFYSSKIPTRIKSNELHLEELQKVIDTLLKKVKVSIGTHSEKVMTKERVVSKSIQNCIFEVSDKTETNTHKTIKFAEFSDKTYVKLQTPSIKKKYNLALAKTMLPSSGPDSDDAYVSERSSLETGLGESIEDSESITSETSQPKTFHRTLHTKQITNFMDYADGTEKNNPYDVILSSYAPQEFLTNSNNRCSQLYYCSQKYPEGNWNNIKIMASTLEYIPILSVRDNDSKILKMEPARSRIINRVKKLTKLESTRIENDKKFITTSIAQLVFSSESSTAKKNGSDDKISSLESEKYSTNRDLFFCDDIPDIATYEEFVAGRLETILDVDSFHEGNSSFQDIVIDTYENFEMQLKCHDQKKLRGLQCSLLESGNIVMTKN